MRHASSVSTPEGLRSPVGDQSLAGPLPGAQRSPGRSSRRDAITNGFWWSLPAARLPPRHICLVLKKADAVHSEDQPASVIRGPHRNATPGKHPAWSTSPGWAIGPFVIRRYAGDCDDAPCPFGGNPPACCCVPRRGCCSFVTGTCSEGDSWTG